MPSIRRRAILSWIALGLVSSSCNQDRPEVRVDLSRKRSEIARSNDAELRFAVGTMLSPRETLRDYLSLTEFVQSRVGRPVRFLQRRGYAETNDLLVRGDVDFAFICAGPFAAIRHSGVSLLAVPVIDGAPTFRSLIVVRADDPAHTFEDLRNGSFAFVDPLSFTGRIYPQSVVRSLARGGQSFFSYTVFTHSHSDSLAMVAEGRIRAAGVESIAFEYLKRHNPTRVAELRVLHESPPFSGPPFVARRGLPADVVKRLQAALLGMHNDAAGRAILSSLGFTRLVSVDDSAYDEVARLTEEVGTESLQ